jgi:hypothetical protein
MGVKINDEISDTAPAIKTNLMGEDSPVRSAQSAIAPRVQDLWLY